MFIRVKKRKTKDKKVKAYAYLVSTKLLKKGPRQKVKKYLGRVYSYPVKKEKETIKVEKDLQQTVLNMLQSELERRGFKMQGSALVNGDIAVKLKESIIKSKKGQKAALELNQGVLCDYTLKQILQIKSERKGTKAFGRELAKALLEVGCSVSSQEFIELFNLASETPTINNNQQQ